MARTAIALAWLAAVACGGGPRGRVVAAVEVRDVEGALSEYARFREADGADVRLLGEVAALVLEKEVLGNDDRDVRNAALVQLRISGTAGRASLGRVSRRSSDVHTRAEALEALAARGDDDARALLYGMLDSPEPLVVATAIAATEVVEDRDRLLELLAHESPVIRQGAALRLGAADEPEILAALTQVARVDSDPSVRNAAVRALGGFGADALAAIRERMGDPDPSVRMAAVRALVRADRDHAEEHLGPLLDTPPGRIGVEAARVIATAGASGVAKAREYLLSVMQHPDTTLRSQAAVALIAIPREAATDAALRALLNTEPDPMVRLGVARALRDDEFAADAQAALRVLLSGEGMPALQAAALLSREGEEAALQLLESTAADTNAVSLLRRVAVRSLAREAGRADDVRVYLEDSDALVRVHAAGGILAAASND